MRDSKEEIQEVVNNIKEFNDTLEMALPLILPEAEKSLELIAPLFDKLLGAIWSGKSFDSLVVMGNASYLARELIKQGVAYEEAPKIAVAMARSIVTLSRQY